MWKVVPVVFNDSPSHRLTSHGGGGGEKIHTPERKDKDDSEEATISGSKRKELNPEEKEQDTAEVTGTPTDHGLEEKEGTILPSTSTKSEDVKPQNTNIGETGLDASLLSPKRHLERQVKL